MIVGLTGPAGSGKTTASKFFNKLGFKIINVDELNHNILQKKQVIEELKKDFPSAIISSKVDRQKLGDIVFNDFSLLSKLNTVLHPLFFKEIKERIVTSDNYLIDMAVLYEAGVEKIVDYVIYLDADEEIRRERLLKRITDSLKVNAIIQSQKKMFENSIKADYYIKNNNSEFELEKMIKKVVYELEKK